MIKRLVALFLVMLTTSVFANWEYGGGYNDDGSRMSFAVRGGITMPIASMKNNLGPVEVDYYNDDDGTIFADDPACTGGSGTCTFLASIDLGKLPVDKAYESFSWVGGASVGMTIPNLSQLRVELDWLHIAESDYNSNPLFKGDVETGAGTLSNSVAAAHATVETDIISAMIYYDFFSGIIKPRNTVIPYVNLGLGYATSTTILSLSDEYHDLPVSFDDFGEQVGLVTDFYTSETKTNNFALSGGLGFNYGIDDSVFFDLGLRVTYVPEIKWALNNGADENAVTSKERDVFSAQNIIFTSLYAGIRFEF